MKHRCPRCGEAKYKEVDSEMYTLLDITYWMACQCCKLLFWFNTYTNKIDTNGNDAEEEYLK